MTDLCYENHLLELQVKTLTLALDAAQIQIEELNCDKKVLYKEIDKLEDREYICKACGLRKDAVFEKGDF